MEIDGLQCDDGSDEQMVEVELDDETIKLLEQMAKERGVTVDELVSDALSAALDKVEIELGLEDIDEDLPSS